MSGSSHSCTWKSQKCLNQTVSNSATSLSQNNIRKMFIEKYIILKSDFDSTEKALKSTLKYCI